MLFGARSFIGIDRLRRPNENDVGERSLTGLEASFMVATIARRYCKVVEIFCPFAQNFCVTRRGTVALDELDHRLLELIQCDAARPLRELGDAVGLSPSAVQRRLSRYRSIGLLAKQVAVLDPEALGGTVLAAVLVTLERESARRHEAFRKRARAAPEVQQCYELAGECDYLLIVVADGMPACRAALERLLLSAPNVKRYSTHFVFDVVKAGLEIPTRGAG